MVRPPYSPGARFRVRTWRGIDLPGRHYNEGEEIPTSDLSPNALYAMYRLFEIDVIEDDGEDPNEPDLPGEEDDAEQPSTDDAQPVKRGRGKSRRSPVAA